MRRPWIGPALAAAVVALSACTGSGQPSPSPTLTDEPVPSSSPTGAQIVTPATDQGVLRYRGVEVAVPLAWLDQMTRPCGTSTADVAFVPERAFPFCGFSTNHPERLTTVSILDAPAQPGQVVLAGGEPLVASVTAAELAARFGAGTTTLRDGRTRVVTDLRPDRPVYVVAISPDAARAAQLSGAGRVVPLAEDCAGTRVVVAAPGNESARLRRAHADVLRVRVGDDVTVVATGPCGHQIGVGFDVNDTTSGPVRGKDGRHFHASAPGTTYLTLTNPTCRAAPTPDCLTVSYGNVKVVVRAA